MLNASLPPHTGQLNIRRCSGVLRTDLFRIKPRETTNGIYTTYLDTIPDDRIDTLHIDVDHCRTGRFGIGVHYVIKMDGTVEIARHPMSIAAYGPQRYRHDHIVAGLIGGRNRDTGKRDYTITQAQRESLEALYQELADALGVPLAISEWVDQEDAEMHAEEKAAAQREADLDAQEASELHG